ncbi:MAG TPA: hypothetical protein VFE54_06080 [Mucilaginibacter sp.]|jgi:hypothetical protein|nr:hypothetical protein [Mucilaginibacter sp.]
MKEIALLSFLAVASLVTSCKEEKLTNEKRAENAVRNYLYNIYGSSNVKIFKFKNFTTYKAYIEQDCKENYERLIKKYPKDSINVKKYCEKEAIDQQIGHEKWYKILCFHQEYNRMALGENFYIDPEFKKVEKEMLFTFHEARKRNNQLIVASNNTVVH